MNANDAIKILTEASNSNVLSCDLSLWYNRVWQFEESENEKIILRLSLETYYSDGVFFRPSDFNASINEKIQLTCYVYVVSEVLPIPSRQLKKELGKQWKVWASGSLDINTSRLKIENEYLVAPMCRLKGKLNGHGITNLGFIAEEWEDPTIDPLDLI